jgi:hypothetical protein
MEELVNLFHGFAVALQPFNIMVMVLGIVLGVPSACCRASAAPTGWRSCCP